MMEEDIVEYNQDVKPYVLSFTLEMSGSRIVGRRLSGKLNKSVQELYSGFAFLEGNSLSDNDYQQAVEACENITKFPIYYVEKPGSVAKIKATIDKFRQEISKDNWLVVTLDHTLLVEGRANQSERDIITELQKMFMQEKKIGITTIIQLTQLNRDIESVDRIMHANMHFPTRKDLSTSDSVYQASDICVVIMRPEIIGIQSYGIQGWSTKDMIYAHIIKQRDGEPKILKFKNDLKYNKITDILD
jgi:replicative DNA helicase